MPRWHQLAAQRTTTEGLPRVYQRLGTSYYNLNLYPQWEEMQKRRGLRTAREIEKALTWDGYSSDGEGFQVIQAQMFNANSERTQ